MLVDSSKFRQRSSLILCRLDRISAIITDDGVRDEERAMVESAGVKLIVAPVRAGAMSEESAPAA